MMLQLHLSAIRDPPRELCIIDYYHRLCPREVLHNRCSRQQFNADISSEPRVPQHDVSNAGDMYYKCSGYKFVCLP